MRMSRPFLACTAALTLTTGLPEYGLSQTSAASGTAPSVQQNSRRSAHVFISVPSIAGSPGNFIIGYDAAEDGKLTTIQGSPFKTAGQTAYIAVGGSYLFSDQGTNIVSYAIAADGALKEASTIDAQKYDNPSTDGFPSTVFTDRTGGAVYDNASAGCDLKSCYQAFFVGRHGSLAYVGTPSYDNPADPYLSFTINDRFAYGSDYVNGDKANFYAFSRDANGALTYFDPNANLPAAASGQNPYVPYGAAAPDDKHVVIALQNGAMAPAGSATSQFAVYEIDRESGTLHTSNTAESMPKISVGSALDYRFDPSGKWLAAAGDTGVEIFEFKDGVLKAKGTTPNTGSQLAWDRDGHLYIFNQSSFQLWVYGVTNGELKLSPGSPYNVPVPAFGAAYMAVEPVQ
jgi:hypothetical protein